MFDDFPTDSEISSAALKSVDKTKFLLQEHDYNWTEELYNRVVSEKNKLIKSFIDRGIDPFQDWARTSLTPSESRYFDTVHSIVNKHYASILNEAEKRLNIQQRPWDFY
ncbi:MAG: hypothetical protein EOO06_12420 [Chitinophagaceae bacterium]|nr:MAG: hypothetical protein EOO06_12420 [Chitinophagaceae bacterium]